MKTFKTEISKAERYELQRCLAKLAKHDMFIFFLPCTDNPNMAASIDIKKLNPICSNGDAIQFNLTLDKDFEINEKKGKKDD